MLRNKTILAIIPARGGSKGIPRKNIKLLAGKPLIAWTIEEAKKSKFVDRLILSSEDSEITHIAEQYGCEVPFLRPEELARDDTPGIDPVLHAIKTLKEKYDYVVLLQPTSPLRVVEDIDGCIAECVTSFLPSYVSITEVSQHPYWMYKLNNKGVLLPLINQKNLTPTRQELPPVYILNGAIYISDTGFLIKHKSFLNKETKGYLMPDERSLDIDTEIDFKICELFLNERNN